MFDQPVFTSDNYLTNTNYICPGKPLLWTVQINASNWI